MNEGKLVLKIKHKQNQFFLFFWIGFFILIILNIFIWLYLNQIEEKFKDELKNKLAALNKITSKFIEDSDIEIGLIIPGTRYSLEYLYYQQLFKDIRQSNELQNIILVSPQQEIVVSSPELLSEQKRLNLYENANFEEALSGKPSVSKLEDYAGEKFMSAYAPIRNIDGFTIGILILEAKATYFNVLLNLRNRLLLFSLLNFILIILVALLLFRMIKRSIKYQTELQAKEHLVKLGTVAATVAHELRNPLNIIEGTNDIIRKKYSTYPDEIFNYIPEEIKRLSIFIDNFLKFARTPNLHIEKKQLSYLIERIHLNLSNPDKSRILIDERESDFELVTDYHLLEQAIMNILTNALEATGNAGKVQVRFIKLKRTRIKISIQDNGSGIPLENLDKIYDPFFTTKETGTGLGLSITKRIVEQLNGNLVISSKKDEGTTVELTLTNLRPLKSTVIGA